jgi:hypothetical protein
MENNFTWLLKFPLASFDRILASRQDVYMKHKKGVLMIHTLKKEGLRKG